MPYLANFNMHRQNGRLSCWVGATRSVLDFYGSTDGTEQLELVSLFSVKGRESGDAERILRAAGALRNSSSKLGGSDDDLRQAPLLFLRIKDSITRGEPILVLIRPCGGRSLGHVLVIYGYENHNRMISLKDPARPNHDIHVPLDQLILSFAPYRDHPGMETLRFYTEKFMFTQQPPRWRSNRLVMHKQYTNFYK